jgi:hypothetical protein
VVALRIQSIADAVRVSLQPTDRKPAYMQNPMPSGCCYAASEALFHLAGGKDAGLSPERIEHEGVSHWYLRTVEDEVLDLTAAQFKTPVPYGSGRRAGFLSQKPSKLAQGVIERVRREYPHLFTVESVDAGQGW